jgi:DNA-binding CsgD family transcriptional regulator
MQTENSSLSEREQDVARVLLQGKSNKQIALELGISNRTVEFHLGNIYTKLGVTSRTEAILKLAENDLWKSTGTVQVVSTVAETDDPTENDAKVISRRISMKTIYLVLGGILATVLIVVLIVTNAPVKNVGIEPTAIPTTPATFSTPTETLPAPTLTATLEPEPERVVIPPHTVNGYTATIESYYIDISHIIFQVRVTGNDFEANQLGYTDIYDEYGNLINASGGIGPTLDMDPSLLQLNFEPTTLIKGDRLKGQLAFNVYAGEPSYEILAKFRFDFDLPIYPEVRFFPKQTVSANGMDILVDSVTVTPLFTQVYLCYLPPSNAPWTIGNETVINIAGHETPIYNTAGLFSSFTGSYWGTHSEPYWVPPVKNGVCDKIGFQVGTSNPTSLTLTIPDLENMLPFLQGKIDLDMLYPGLGPRQAYHTYLEEQGSTFEGPWVFNIQLVP